MKKEFSEHIQQILDTLPTKPGCYIYENNPARSSTSARRSTCATGCARISTTPGWISRRASWSSTSPTSSGSWSDSELEALILEMNLIKKHRPHYNIRLKDDKRYPYIKVHWAEPFPKVTVTRQMVQRRLALFRPVHQRVGRPPDAGRAAAHLPLPDLRPRDHRQGPAPLPVSTTSSCAPGRALAPSSRRATAR